MKKNFKMLDLDCANCGAKMENAIKKLDGVNDATISFMSQRLTLDCEEENLDGILKAAQKICKKIESHCRIVVK